MLLVFVACWLPILLFGVGLLILGILKLHGNLRRFVILTGSSMLGFFISVLLTCGLFIYLYGPDFWDRIGTTDKLLFFIIPISICLLGFTVGSIGSVILAIKRRQRTASDVHGGRADAIG